MNKVLIIGSLNMDMVVFVDRIPKMGETTLASSFEKYNGGKGANQAIACSRFEARTYMIGAVGKDEEGKTLLESMESDGVDITGIRICDNQKTGMAWITVDRKGENAIIVIPGANGCVSKEDIDDNEALFNEADIILIQLEIPKETVVYAINKGKEKGCRIILNPAPAVKLETNVLSKVDIITPNETELEILTSPNEGIGIIEKAQKLLALGVGNVVCTLGEKGALLVNKYGYTEFPSQIVDPVDTTGAGDCFNGVLAAELAGNVNMEDAIKSAVKASSISVTRNGAQSSMPRKQDVEK